MFYHMVQSFPKGAAVDPGQAHAAALKLAEYYEGCEVLVCTMSTGNTSIPTSSSTPLTLIQEKSCTWRRNNSKS